MIVDVEIMKEAFLTVDTKLIGLLTDPKANWILFNGERFRISSETYNDIEKKMRTFQK